MKILSLLRFTLAFSYDIHRYLGDNLCKILKDSGQSGYIEHTLNGENCSEASIWADKVKRTSKYIWTAHLHYIDLPECKSKYTKKYINQECHGGQCIFDGILHSYREVYDLNKTENLKFLMHLTQDFFQPFHLYGVFRGGNDLKLIRNKNGHNKTTNLHELFDGEIFEYFIEKGNYKPIVQICPVVIPFFNLEHLLYKKLELIMNIACQFYSRLPESNYVIFEELYDKILIETILDNYFEFAVILFTNFNYK